MYEIDISEIVAKYGGCDLVRYMFFISIVDIF